MEPMELEPESREQKQQEGERRQEEEKRQEKVRRQEEERQQKLHSLVHGLELTRSGLKRNPFTNRFDHEMLASLQKFKRVGEWTINPITNLGIDVEPGVGISIFILDEQNRFLMQQRGDVKNHGAHHWEIPGGGREEFDLSDEHGGVRETKEETNLDVDFDSFRKVAITSDMHPPHFKEDKINPEDEDAKDAPEGRWSTTHFYVARKRKDSAELEVRPPLHPMLSHYANDREE